LQYEGRKIKTAIFRPVAASFGPVDTEHVLWIGGPSGSGKTTVARQLARRHGLRWYNCDARTWIHRDRALRAGNPAAELFERLTPAERGRASLADAIAMSLHTERGLMVLDDIAELPREPLIVVDGTLVVPEIAGPHAVWLMPSAVTQRLRLEEREGRMAPTAPMWREAIGADVRAAGVRTIDVDALTPAGELAAVEAVFADRIGRGPTATSLVERRRLIRESNVAIVNQYRAGLARPWATATPETVVRPFDCECARPDCSALVRLTIAAFPDDHPLLAPGH
jgi:cytidylate kinase